MYDHIKISLSLCLVVRGRHVGGVISWGRHDRFPSDEIPCKIKFKERKREGNLRNLSLPFFAFP